MTVMQLTYRGSGTVMVDRARLDAGAGGPVPQRTLSRREIVLYSGAAQLAAPEAAAVGSARWLAAIDAFVAACAGAYVAVETDDPTDSPGGI